MTVEGVSLPRYGDLWPIEQATTYNVNYHLRVYFSSTVTFRKLLRAKVST